MTAEKARGLGVKIDVDVSEALTGLKALQREAKEATRALRELEEQAKRNSLLPCGVVAHLSQGERILPMSALSSEPDKFTATLRSCSTGEVIAELPGMLRRDYVD